MMSPSLVKTSAIEAVMDVVDQPMFLMDVEGAGLFRFRRLNRCHQALTGMSNATVAGHAPHDILPPRLADTLVKNYETCRSSATSYSYEENLDLSSGARWWHTSLTPVADGAGNLRHIIGLAADITAQKRRQFQIEQRMTEISRLNADLQVFAASTAQNMRGPFQTMAALLDLVRQDFVDFGDEKVEQLALCSEVAERAIASMTGVLSAAEQLQVGDVICDRVNLPHVLSDIAAMIDPHRRLNMNLPKEWVETDAAALQMVLRRVMENAVHYADRQITIVVSEQAGGLIALTVADDGASNDHTLRCDGTPVLPSHGASICGLSSARAIVEARGGTMSSGQSPFDHGAAITFTMPGALIPTPHRALDTTHPPIEIARPGTHGETVKWH